MNENFIIFRFSKIKYRFEYFIFYFYKLHCLINTLFINPSNNSNRIPYKSYMSVKYEPVIRTWLRICLSGTCKTFHILVNIFICKNCLYSRYFHCYIRINILNNSISIRRTQQLHNKTVIWCNIICIHRLSKQKLHRIFFSYSFINCFHYCNSFSFLALI